MAYLDITECTIVGNDDGVLWQTTLHYETILSVGLKITELQALIDALKENLIYKQLTNDALDFMHLTNTLTEIRLRDVDDPTIGLDSPIPAGDGDGKLTGQRKANVLAFLTRKATEKVGRSYQGRNYWNFLSEETLDGDNVNPAQTLDILDWFSTMVAIVPVIPIFGFRLMVHSPTLFISTPVTEIGVRGRMKTQRSRAN